MSDFPNSLDSLPKPSGTTEMDEAGFEHGPVHSDLAAAIEAVQEKVGVDDSTVPTTVDYRLDRLEDVVLDVRDYGATGDGSTDDTTAIQDALNAVPAVGGSGGGATVYFPEGRYMITSPLVVKDGTRIQGSQPHLDYHDSTDFNASCAIALDDTFSGTACLDIDREVENVMVIDIILLGRDVGTGINGIEITGSGSGSQGHVFTRLAINGFTGHGFSGRLHVARFDGLMVGNCHGRGIRANYFTDVQLIQGWLFNNREGAMLFDDSFGTSGMVQIFGVRFERSGWDASNPTSPHTTDAPGIHIRRARQIVFVGCQTDANSGHGVHIEQPSGGQQSRLNDLLFTVCTFIRDGFGDMSTQEPFAGIKIESPNAINIGRVRFVECVVGKGKATDDGTEPSYDHPHTGLSYEYTDFFAFSGTAEGDQVDIENVGNNFRPMIVESGEMVEAYRLSPENLVAEHLEINIPDDRPDIDFRTTTGDRGRFRWYFDGVLRTEMFVFEDGNVVFSRYDDTGAWLDNPLTIQNWNGRIQAEHDIRANDEIRSETGLRVNDAGAGLTLHSPDGTRYLVTVDNSGNLDVSAV